MPSVLYVNPSRVVCLPYRKPRPSRENAPKDRKKRSKAQQDATSQNLKNNASTGKVSAQTKAKISSAIQWLCYLTEPKTVIDPDTKYEHLYRVGLVTLSLPTGCENVTPGFFVNVLLRQALDAMNYQFKLKNYIWKIELQERGAPHAHITLDEFIPHKWLRYAWCKILDKHGLLDNYTALFENMSLKDYVSYRLRTDKASYTAKFPSRIQLIRSYVKAYRFGVTTGWKLPNCTDVHSVKNVKNLAGYMVKYLSKDAGFGAGYKGRVWSASYSLSRLKSIKCELPGDREHMMCHTLTEIATDTYEKFLYNRYKDEYNESLSMWYLPRSVKKIESVSWLKRFFALVKSAYESAALQVKPHVDWDYNFNPYFVTN